MYTKEQGKERALKDFERLGSVQAVVVTLHGLPIQDIPCMTR